jgi:hypothetical protein
MPQPVVELNLIPFGSFVMEHPTSLMPPPAAIPDA